MDRVHRVWSDAVALSCSAPIPDYHRLGWFRVVGQMMGFLCGQGLLGCLTSVSYLLSRHYIVLHAIGIAANRGLRWIVSTTYNHHDDRIIESQTHYRFEFTFSSGLFRGSQSRL